MTFPEVLEFLTQSRNLSMEELEGFLNPDYKSLHDPMHLPDMDKAASRVIRAVKDGEHIVVFADYDADGIPAAVVMSDFFKRIGYSNVSFYIPHRHNEGFGLNIAAIDECAERGTKLIVTVDCGIADLEEVAHAQDLGMDVIVTDHHEQMDELPRAFAVVNPKRRDSIYPFKELCGAAVAYKLVQAIISKDSFGVRDGMEKWSLDVVGIATLSDMVPLVGENRILARFGLDVLRKSPRVGLRALLNKLNIDQRYVNEDDIAFMITPRINAASRMGSPEDAFKLLATEDEAEARVYADHLEKINNERKGVVASLVKDARKHLEERETIGEVIVIGNPEWRPSLLGLVANSLVEEYLRPAFVWGRDGDGTLKGSCRSYNGCNLFALMNMTASSFQEFGGHAGAGGFSITLENLTELEENLSKAFESMEKNVLEEKEKGIRVSVSDIGEDLWKTISGFAPFGMGNPKPVFEIRGNIKSLRQFGKESNHLELVLGDGKREVKAISFFSTPSSYSTLPATGGECNLLAHLEKSYFRNRPELRLRVVDINSAV